MFEENEKGYRLTAKNYRWWSLQTLLLSVAAIRRILLKTNLTEERCVHTKSESCNIWRNRKKKQFNSKHIIQILQPIIIYNCSTQWLKKILWNVSYIRMRRKIINDCNIRPNDLFGIKFISLRSESRMLQLSEFV